MKKKKNSKKKQDLKKSYLWIILLLIIIIVGLVIYIVFNNGNKDYTKIYENLLNKEETFEGAKEADVTLIDLDNNKVPELLITLPKLNNNYITKIYTIKDNKPISNIVAAYEQYTFEYLYNKIDDLYNWYAVTTNSHKIYNLGYSDKEYVKESELNYQKDIIFVKKQEDTVHLNLTDKKEIDFNKINKTWTKNEKLINDEVKNKVETSKMMSNIKKIDESKNLVYTVKSVKSDVYGNISGQTYHNYYEYPAINIDSEDVKAINEKLKSEAVNDSNGIATGFFGEINVITYEYFINDNILSILSIEGGNSSTWVKAYNVDLKTSKEISTAVMLKEQNLDNVKDKVKEFANSLIDKSYEEVKDFPGFAEEYNNLKKDLDDNLNKIENVYLNKNNELVLLVDFEVFGGQYTCTKTVAYNLAKNEVSEVKYETYVERGQNNQNEEA